MSTAPLAPACTIDAPRGDHSSSSTGSLSHVQITPDVETGIGAGGGVGGVLTLAWYLALRTKIESLGYAHEIEWAQTVQPVSDALTFWGEFAWVVLNSGMKNQVAQGIWNRVQPAVLAGGSAGDVFGHKGKSAAIDYVYANRERLLAEYHAATDKLEWLRALPWIGGITCWHLAKNYGHDCAKPDRHLERIAGTEGTHALCARLSRESGDRIATVDLVIWRAANLGLAGGGGRGGSETPTTEAKENEP